MIYRVYADVTNGSSTFGQHIINTGKKGEYLTQYSFNARPLNIGSMLTFLTFICQQQSYKSEQLQACVKIKGIKRGHP